MEFKISKEFIQEIEGLIAEKNEREILRRLEDIHFADIAEVINESQDPEFLEICTKYYKILENLKESDLSIASNTLDQIGISLNNELDQYNKKKNDKDPNTYSTSTIKCKALIEHVRLYGDNFQSVDLLRLSSSWLKEVKAFEVYDKIVVIAQIYISEARIATMEYIFCDIPRRNWDKFYEPIFNTNLTYGEKFHEYINPYKCDCE